MDSLLFETNEGLLPNSPAAQTSFKPAQFNISARTDRIIAECRLESATRFYPVVFTAYYAVKRAEQTGRLWGTAALALRGLSGYQYAKLVLSFVGVRDMDDVARQINALYPTVL